MSGHAILRETAENPRVTTQTLEALVNMLNIKGDDSTCLEELPD